MLKQHATGSPSPSPTPCATLGTWTFCARGNGHCGGAGWRPPSTQGCAARGVPGGGGAPADIDERVSRVLASGSLPRERREKRYDLRPLILHLEVGEEAVPSLGMRLKLQGARAR